MSRFELWLHHLSNVLVGGTGVVYAVMRYLMEPSDPFAIVNHPWQPHVQHLHILFAPLLVFAVGLSWQGHIAPRLTKSKMPRYKTGVALFLSLVPMIVSGYLIQTAVADDWRRAWVVVHLVASTLWLLGYLSHQIAPRKSTRTTLRSQDQDSRASRPAEPYGMMPRSSSRPSQESDRRFSSDEEEVVTDHGPSPRRAPRDERSRRGRVATSGRG